MLRCNQLWAFTLLSFGVGILVGCVCQSGVLSTILALGAMGLGICILGRRK